MQHVEIAIYMTAEVMTIMCEPKKSEFLHSPANGLMYHSIRLLKRV